MYIGRYVAGPTDATARTDRCGVAPAVAVCFVTMKEWMIKTRTYAINVGGKNMELPLNEHFTLKAVEAFTTVQGQRHSLGWQLKLYNKTDRPLRIAEFYAMPGIVDEALQGDPIFPTPEAAIEAWGDSFTYTIGYLAAQADKAKEATFDHSKKNRKRSDRNNGS